ncbi:hypothetical protein chiPu_0027044 [Chiloscyllium punctatum]|uniref:Uncharacterized protein n=1 Tax=Chiloscyllium punctatum TaxID=137246 RepID=A0A401TKQ8_CHIPU|nr:hypothetical protein [Chiloscyllium punctatum]
MTQTQREPLAHAWDPLHPHDTTCALLNRGYASQRHYRTLLTHPTQLAHSREGGLAQILPLDSHLSEEEVDFVIVWVVALRDPEGAHKLGICAEKQEFKTGKGLLEEAEVHMRAKVPTISSLRCRLAQSVNVGNEK